MDLLFADWIRSALELNVLLIILVEEINLFPLPRLRLIFVSIEDAGDAEALDSGGLMRRSMISGRGTCSSFLELLLMLLISRIFHFPGVWPSRLNSIGLLAVGGDFAARITSGELSGSCCVLDSLFARPGDFSNVSLLALPE